MFWTYVEEDSGYTGQTLRCQAGGEQEAHWRRLMQ